MLDRIHQSKVIDIMQQRKDGKPVEFSITYCKKSTGELITYPAAVITSVHSKGSTVNIMEVGDYKPRSIRKCLITRINNLKVYF